MSSSVRIAAARIRGSASSPINELTISIDKDRCDSSEQHPDQNGPDGEPAWRSKPSWYLVTTDDRMIRPSLQREMSRRAGSTVVETPGSHSIYVSQPAVVVNLVERAASEVGSPRLPRAELNRRPAADEVRAAGRSLRPVGYMNRIQ
jgi:pimeloyl-ACP methyl ester carboxylesterase